VLTNLSPRSRQIVLGAVAIAALLLVAAAGVGLARQLSTRNAQASAATPTAAALVAEQKAAPTQPAPVVVATPRQAQPVATRVAVPGGRVDTDTGIAIMPVVNLRGDRRYVMQITSKAGAVEFQGSHTRGSIDPKIAIDVVSQIKGSTTWEQEIPPPAADSRTWTLGASVSTNPPGKNVAIQIWDIGPKS
jgi:hypothetical protein